MPHARRYRRTWEQVASIDADYLQTNWGAFDGGAHPIEVDGATSQISGALVSHNAEANTLRVIYAADTGEREKVHADTVITLERQTCNLGGSRFVFLAPCCGKRARKLALLPGRVACRQCGSITYESRRKSGLPAIVHAADILGGRLRCDNWYSPPTERPRGMSKATFMRLAAKHDALVAKANSIVQPRLIRAQKRSGIVGRYLVMARAGM